MLKWILTLAAMIATLSGCIDKRYATNNDSRSTATLVTATPPAPMESPTIPALDLRSAGTDQPGNTLTVSEAVYLIISKLDEEMLRVSNVREDGMDKDGNYIIRQSSKATTVVMEWYHVNPITSIITCEIMKENCLKPYDTSSVVKPNDKLHESQKKALLLAEAYAKKHLTNLGYVENITFVHFAGIRDNGELTFQVFNPGAGRTETIDWLNVDIETEKVTPMFFKE